MGLSREEVAARHRADFIARTGSETVTDLGVLRVVASVLADDAERRALPPRTPVDAR